MGKDGRDIVVVVGGASKVEEGERSDAGVQHFRGRGKGGGGVVLAVMMVGRFKD